MLTGAGALRRRLVAAKRLAPALLKAATEEALSLLETEAQRILAEEVYTHAESSNRDSDSLYRSFVQKLVAVGSTVAGQLINKSDHAIYWEFGTSRGVPAVRFLERALTENREQILAIYRKHFSSLFD